jgi:hypothetical protein
MTNYKNINTEKLVNMWCYNSNDEECRKMEEELENRGIELTAENVQKILLSE